MAETQLPADSARVIPYPYAIAPMPAVARILSRYDRPRLAAFITVAIDLLDAIDGDPDLEPGGDDEPREAEGDAGDTAWIEWTAMHGRKKRGPNIASQSEDDEPTGDELDGNGCEDDFMTHAAKGPGCPIADPGEPGGDDESGMMAVHWPELKS